MNTRGIRKRAVVGQRRAALGLLGLVVMLGCGRGSEQRAQPFAKQQSALYPKRTTLWNNWSIPVCWENATADDAEERGWVRAAVEASWMQAARVSFVGWGMCSASSDGVRIRIDDSGPRVVALGQDLDGVMNGMFLNFTFENWSPVCQGEGMRQFCIEVIAVHEFGHALGLAHEQNRPDTPTECDQEQGTDGDFTIGAWDQDSVMNYCNPAWGGNGVLSDTDRAGIGMLYGGYHWRSASQVLGDGSGVHQHKTLTGDVNGDGRSDLIFVGQGWSGPGLTVRTKLANGDGSWTPITQVLGDGSGVHAHPALTGDVDGDGRTDIIFVGQGWSGPGLNIRTKLSNGDGTWDSRAQVLGDGPAVHEYATLIGDVNGDGRSDLIFVGQGWSGPGLNVRTKLSNGDGTWSSRSAVLGDGSGVHQHATLTGDVNGDGRTDLIFVGQGWSGPGLTVRTKLSNGDGSWAPVTQVLGDGSGVHQYPTLTGDINGDGRTDLVFVGQGWSGAGLNVRTKLSAGDGTWISRSQVVGDGSGVHRYPTLLADADGDGKDDLVFVGQSWIGTGLNIRSKLSRGDGTWTSRFDVMGDGSGVHAYPPLTGDANGDGKADLIFVGQGWSGPGLNVRTKFAQ